jgi:hypothetical protein
MRGYLFHNDNAAVHTTRILMYGLIKILPSYPSQLLDLISIKCLCSDGKTDQFLGKNIKNLRMHYRKNGVKIPNNVLREELRHITNKGLLVDKTPILY